MLIVTLKASWGKRLWVKQYEIVDIRPYSTYKNSNFKLLNIIAIIRVGWEWGTSSISLIKVSCLFTSPSGKHHPYCPVYSMIACRFLTPFLFTHCLSCYSYILVCGFLSMRNILSYSLHSY